MSLSRRSFFQHATSLSLAAVVPFSIETARSDGVLQELVRRRAQLKNQRDELDARWLRIYRQLPERYRAGPKYVGEDGIPFGPLVGWPAADDNEAIRLTSGVLIRRPSPTDLRELFVQEAAELSRKIGAERYRKRVSQLRGRCRAKRAYLRESGLPTSSDWGHFDQQLAILDEYLERIRVASALTETLRGG